MGLSAGGETLFQDAAILMQLGYTVDHIQQGFNRRHASESDAKSEESLPCHPEVLRQELTRIDLESLHEFRRQHVRTLFERRLVRGRTYALDGTGLGTRWRVVGLLNVNPECAVWVTWRVLSGSASEKGQEASVVREMVDEVREVGGADAIEWLLMDALYADGPLLVWLKYQREIDAMVRCLKIARCMPIWLDWFSWSPSGGRRIGMCAMWRAASRAARCQRPGWGTWRVGPALWTQRSRWARLKPSCGDACCTRWIRRLRRWRTGPWSAPAHFRRAAGVYHLAAALAYREYGVSRVQGRVACRGSTLDP